MLSLAQQTAAAPVAQNDTVAVPESAATSIQVLGNDNFIETPTLEVITQPPSGDSVVVSGNVINYMAGAVGADTVRTFQYRFTTAAGISNTATVNVTVQNTNIARAGIRQLLFR